MVEILHSSVTFIFVFFLLVKVYCATYCALYCAVVKQHIITTALIFSCQNNSFLINYAPLFKFVTFNILLFDVALFYLVLFDAALFDVELF